MADRVEWESVSATAASRPGKSGGGEAHAQQCCGC